MSNVNTGDLAYITGLAKGPCMYNNGHVVLVGKRVTGLEDGRLAWWVTPQAPLMQASGKLSTKIGRLSDKYMRKISGPDIDVSVSATKNIREPA